MPADRRRALRLAGALVGACRRAGRLQAHRRRGDDRRAFPTIIACAIRSRSRKPDRSIVVFVGHGRGGLSASQRADVMGLAQTWMREGTGGISIDVPVDTPNARAAADSLREIQAMLAAAGVPPRGISRPPVSPGRSAAHGRDPAELSEDRRRSPAPAACGRRTSARRSTTRAISRTSPTTISAAPISATWRRWSTIRRISCSRGPKPRPTRRGARTAFEKYRKGTTTATTYPEADKAKLSDTGK